MEIFKISLSSLGSISILFILMKILGNRQMSQLGMFDYINGITIGSMAAEMATSPNKDFFEPLIAMLIYTTAICLFSFISQKSLKARKVLDGSSYVLFENGKLIQKNFKKAKLDINEFLTQCRINGYFNLSDLYSATLETSGQISFLPLATKRPATAEDLNLSPIQDKAVFNIIIDGKIIDDNLKASGNDEIWLNDNLNKQNQTNLTNIFLATCDSNNNLNIYKKH